MLRKVLFIVNPNAGKKISDYIVELIRKEFPQNVYYHVVVWKSLEHFNEISDMLQSGDYTDAVAVGGDGTVNRVATAILGTGISLGIVPIGSGNGLARSLGLSMDFEEVIRQIAEGRTALIDNGTMNALPFFCTSGLGFDAHIGNLFASSKKRGLSGYIKIILREIFRYRAKNYILKFNDREIKRKSFLITVANAGQYGNDYYIAPQANMQDGLFHISLLRAFNPFQIIGLMLKFINKKVHQSRLIETITTNKITIIRENKDPVHYDGEPSMEKEEVMFECHHRTLKVIVGEGFKVL